MVLLFVSVVVVLCVCLLCNDAISPSPNSAQFDVPVFVVDVRVIVIVGG